MERLKDVGYLKTGMTLLDANGTKCTVEVVNDHSGVVTINGQVIMWDWGRLSDDVMVLDVNANE